MVKFNFKKMLISLIELISLFYNFASIVCVIVLNLFVGIAVGEISVVLDEADIQQIGNLDKKISY
jgi:hypothetical protein